MRQSRLSPYGWIALAVAILMTSLVSSQAWSRHAVARGINDPFPDWAAEGRRDRIGLFIGINHYPDPETSNLKGCVNDAMRMRELFRARFGFDRTMLITDEEATRQGIGTALRQFYEQVERAAAASDGRVDAVLYFAGHGSQVKDQNGDEDADHRDETWVAHDSGLRNGSNDIRDDELEAVAKAVSRLGVQLLIISDSCHSGSIHRGDSLTLSRSVKRTEPVDGPSEPLFPEFDSVSSSLTGSASDAGLEGDFSDLDVVMFSACRASELAWEGLDENGNRSGRFTASIHKVLRESGRTTYAELHRRVVAEMARRWPDGSQRPQLEFTQGNLDEYLLQDGIATKHALIQRNSVKGGKCLVLEGTLHGVRQNANCLFYPSLEALEDQPENPAVVGVVKDVTPFTSTVELPANASITDTFVASIDVYETADFSVWIDDSVNDDVVTAVTEAGLSNAAWLLARDTDEADVVVAAIPGSDRVGVYRPTAVPRGVEGASGNGTGNGNGDGDEPPVPMRESSPETLVDDLVDLSRSHRLMALSYREGHVFVEVVVKDETTGEWTPISGVPRLNDGTEFALRVENLTTSPLYVYILSFSHDHSVEYLFPGPSDHELRLLPNRPVTIGEDLPFIGVVDRPHDLGPDGAERTHLKVIGTAERFDLQRLVRGDREAVTRGIENPFERALTDVFGDSVFGQTRGHPRRSGIKPMSWATTTITFDVVQ